MRFLSVVNAVQYNMFLYFFRCVSMLRKAQFMYLVVVFWPGEIFLFFCLFVCFFKLKSRNERKAQELSSKSLQARRGLGTSNLIKYFLLICLNCMYSWGSCQPGPFVNCRTSPLPHFFSFTSSPLFPEFQPPLRFEIEHRSPTLA